MKTHDLSYPKAVIELAIKDLTPNDLEHKAACEFALKLLALYQEFQSDNDWMLGSPCCLYGIDQDIEHK